MSDVIPLLFVLLVSPLAAAAGFLFWGRAAELFRLNARVSRWSLRLIGLDSSAIAWMATPLHRRLFGDPATFLDRACEDPSQFRLVVWLIRIRVPGAELLFPRLQRHNLVLDV